jgi:hypothetical protein
MIIQFDPWQIIQIDLFVPWNFEGGDDCLHPASPRSIKGASAIRWNYLMHWKGGYLSLVLVSQDLSQIFYLFLSHDSALGFVWSGIHQSLP